MRLGLKLKRILYKPVYPFKKMFWFIFRPKTFGVQVVVKRNNEFLLVRLGYAHGLWTFPGGKIDRGETNIEAAHREIREETGLKIKNVKKIGEYKTEKEYKKDTVFCFVASPKTRGVKIDEFEVIESGWFRKNNLPKDRADQVDKILDMIIQ